MDKKIIMGVILLVLAITVVAIFIIDFEEVTKEEEQLKTVYTEKPVIEDISSTIELNGKVRKKYEILDANVIQGKIDKVFVQVGDVVTIGDALLKVSTLGDKDTINYQISQLEAAISEVEIAYEQITEEKTKIERLYASQAIAQQEVTSINNELVRYSDQLKALKKQKNKLLQSRKNIDQVSLITASIDGIVKEVTIAPESYMTNNDFLKIEKTGGTEVVFYITEKYLDKVAINKDVSVEIHHETYQGTIQRIKSIDATGLFYPIIVTLKAPIKYKHGMNATISLPVDEKSGAIVIDDRSIIRFNDEAYVFLVENGKVTKRQIKTGKNINNKTEILEGLDVNDAVITRGQFSVINGEQVENHIND